ncbi:MAG: TonB-dependent receptor [Candidatus Synoicihabitans palmerolidicus]|nr:TonB-dependent receptor [Candidatus Synoicihabitans palmerolidicus]
MKFICLLTPANRWLSALSRAATAAMLLVGTVATAWAQSESDSKDVDTLDALIVSANRAPTDPLVVTSAVTLIKPESLRSAQIDDLASALAQVPGLSVVPTGGGGPTAVFMRGGAADHTVFLVDGVRMNTPDASYAQFLGAAGTLGLDRIEVLAGPQSTLYGSAALEGVIVMDTTRGGRDSVGRVRVSAGSFDSYDGAVELHGGTGKLGYSASIAATSTANDRERNDAQSVASSTRLETKLNEALTLGWTLRGQESSADAPGSVGSPYIGEVDTTDNLSTVYGQWQFDDTLSSRLTYEWVQREYTYTPVPPPLGSPRDSPYFSQDTRNVSDWQTNWDPTAAISVVGGVAVETETITSVTPSGVDGFDNDSRGAYVMAHTHLVADTTLQAGLRYDDFARWGDATTWKTGVSRHWATTGTKLRANYGTGFAAPRPVYVTGGPFYNPNPTLLPEESKGWDLGFDQTLVGDRLVLGVTYFENRFRNLFTYDFSIPGIINTGKATSRGLETALALTPMTE